MWVHHYLFGSGSGSRSGSRSFHQQAKKIRKTFIFTILRHLFDFLSLRTAVNVPWKSNKQRNFRKNLFFCWHLVSHWRKKQIPDPDLYVSGTYLGIRIRIRSVPKCHGSIALFKNENWRGVNLLERRVGCIRCQETVRVRTQALPSLHTHTA
jgi:hypothetical protein